MTAICLKLHLHPPPQSLNALRYSLCADGYGFARLGKRRLDDLRRRADLSQ
jgi:hypothetical protein